jgi:hypothetical protein
VASRFAGRLAPARKRPGQGVGGLGRHAARVAGSMLYFAGNPLIAQLSLNFHKFNSKRLNRNPYLLRTISK